MYRDDAEAHFARLEAVMRENEELRRENDELRSWTGATTRTELLLTAALTGPVVLGTLYCLSRLW